MEKKTGENEDLDIDSGPVNFEEDEKVHKAENEMNSFIPTNIDSKNEKEILDEPFLNAPQSFNWDIGGERLNA